MRAIVMSWQLNRVLYDVPYAIMLVIALLVLARFRGKARKATKLAFIAWFGLAGWGSYETIMIVIGYDSLKTLTPSSHLSILLTQDFIRSVGYAACLLLLCVAVGTDRPGGAKTGRKQGPCSVRDPR